MSKSNKGTSNENCSLCEKREQCWGKRDRYPVETKCMAYKLDKNVRQW